MDFFHDVFRYEISHILHTYAVVKIQSSPGRIFFAVEKITQLETEEIKMEKRKIILDCDPGHDDAIAK